MAPHNQFKIPVYQPFWDFLCDQNLAKDVNQMRLFTYDQIPILMRSKGIERFFSFMKSVSWKTRRLHFVSLPKHSSLPRWDIEHCLYTSSFPFWWGKKVPLRYIIRDATLSMTLHYPWRLTILAKDVFAKYSMTNLLNVDNEDSTTRP